MSSAFISEPSIQYLGVSSHLFFVLGFAVLFLTTFIFIYARTGNRFLTSIITLVSLGLGCLWGVFPIWIVFIYCTLSIYWVFFLPIGSAPVGNETSETDDISHSSWYYYGERIKLAYDAKFGGTNPEFNKEIDFRVQQVERLRGITSQIAADKIKRYAKMTECR